MKLPLVSRHGRGLAEITVPANMIHMTFTGSVEKFHSVPGPFPSRQQVADSKSSSAGYLWATARFGIQFKAHMALRLRPNPFPIIFAGSLGFPSNFPILNAFQLVIGSTSPRTKTFFKSLCVQRISPDTEVRMRDPLLNHAR
jgi:hypothetical protein